MTAKLKKKQKVHFECDTPANYRWFIGMMAVKLNPVGILNGDGSVTIVNPDKFADMLAAANGKIIK